VYDSVEVACRCVAALSEYGAYLKSYEARTNFVLNWGAKAKSKGEAIIEAARKEGRRVLLEPEAKELVCLHYGKGCRDKLATTEEEAVAVSREIGGAVALKIVSPDILHKTEAGGVKLNLRTSREVGKGYRSIIDNAKEFAPDADVRGVLVSPMVESGVEVIVGTKLDDQFGPVLMFGLGGVMVEVLKDVAFRVLPTSHRSVKHMISEIKAAKILNGYRGLPPTDLKALRRFLSAVSEMVEAYPDIMEIDLNPVRTLEEGLEIVDARIILKEAEASS